MAGGCAATAVAFVLRAPGDVATGMSAMGEPQVTGWGRAGVEAAAGASCCRLHTRTL